MRSKIALAPLCVSIALSLACIVAAPMVNAAPPSDACSLLTKTEIKSVVGVAVADGKHPGKFPKQCMWTPPGGPSKALQNIELTLQSADSFQASKSMLEAVVNSPKNQSSKSPIRMIPATGVGNDAFYSSVGSYSNLIVKKDDAVFQLVIYSNASIEKRQSMEKALASKIASKL